MTDNHEIERLTFELVSLLDRENVDKFIEDSDGNLVRVETYSLYEVAKSLVNKGYGNIERVVTAFIDKIKETASQMSDSARTIIDEILKELGYGGDIPE